MFHFFALDPVGIVHSEECTDQANNTPFPAKRTYNSGLEIEMDGSDNASMGKCPVNARRVNTQTATRRLLFRMAATALKP